MCIYTGTIGHVPGRQESTHLELQDTNDVNSLKMRVVKKTQPSEVPSRKWLPGMSFLRFGQESKQPLQL